ncbi:hypothetical protein JQT66_11115 [Sulfitobacter mediterraneus]|nr:hypothetical protein [Sulfitobacter mediterraneus]MBM1310781.1 hypothetical protein [Sulfitobacter mediterraneus]MBM1314665.1 hypothetical protein [Sulfitobacter mediterraneus]MBM1323025.1 hypothetical protein [Sulfitobacter mediterraneus]MBM1326937.1 hypothetical protein [Sulfitobacter mediterraneus]MBM1398283.1 hypothetical protein [Sulfitobacter mediterraneus]
MMSNNKILTVSYGTFSCTLEGFEDSFGTMKAIAEYFRDLASDDRYFGAEPPQPDAEMLARIAQKEMTRRVEAREQDGKIVLSAHEQSEAAPAPAPAAIAAPAAAVVAAAPAVQLPQEDVAVAEAPVVISTAAPADIADLKPAAQEPAPAAQDTAVDTPDIVPGQPDAEVEAFFAEADHADANHTFEDQDTLSPSAPVAASARVATVAAAVSEDAEASDVLPTEEISSASVTPKEDSIAAKLQRIRAVVAQNEVAEEEADFLEDEHADAAQADEPVADVQDDDEVDSILSALSNTDIDEDDSFEDDTDEVETAQDTAEDDADDDELASSLSNLFDEEDVKPADADALADLAALADAEDADTADEAKAPAARVIKVNRAELEAALKDDGQDTGETPKTPAEDVSALDQIAPSKTDETALTPEDEEDLVAELSSLEAELEEDTATAAPEIAEEAPAPTAARRVLPSIDEDDQSSDVNRLLAETDQQMDEPESATRRDAFAHLRAAVAAKKADVAMGQPETEDGDDDAYRSDLAEVVRPRRPSSEGRTKRPGDNRPAPLKLVAEQRIDVARPASEGPVRPRRVAAVADPVETPDGESFADYAAEMGATKLPELLEAAAAYMSFVEGRKQFSRPQLMTKVRQVSAEDGFSREDGLRSFGQLLRSGKIEKIKGGRFTVSDDIGYRPGERAAG